jgi:hypothetical protein
MGSMMERRLEMLEELVRLSTAPCTCDGAGLRVVFVEDRDVLDELPANCACEAHGTVLTVIFDDPTIRPIGARTGRKPQAMVD